MILLSVMSWISFDTFKRKEARENAVWKDMHNRYELLKLSKGLSFKEATDNYLWYKTEKEELLINGAPSNNYLIVSQKDSFFESVKFLCLMHFTDQKLDEFSCLLVDYENKTICLAGDKKKIIKTNPDIWTLDDIAQNRALQKILFDHLIAIKNKSKE